MLPDRSSQPCDEPCDGYCLRNCATGEQKVVRNRYCRCIVENDPTEYDDTDCYDSNGVYITEPTECDFGLKCQPCIGPRTQTDTCELPDCTLDTPTGSTAEVYHHSCCSASTAIRVSSESFEYYLCYILRLWGSIKMAML